MERPLFMAPFCLFFIFGLPAMLGAQSTQTGILEGTVTTPEGQPLPGVSVTIKSPALVLPELSTLTSEGGIYRFPALPPGLYEISFFLPEMKTVIRQDIKINVGQVTTINVSLEPRILDQEITIVGQAPTIDAKTSAKTVNLDKNNLASLPAPRLLYAYGNMIPGIVSEETSWWSDLSSQGSAVNANTFNLDGLNITDVEFGNQFVEFSVDIMEEISFQTGGLPAEYGDSSGTVINVVTKSGTNRYSGSASIYYSNENLQSHNTEGTPLEGQPSGYGYMLEPGLTFGGPILRDRLTFFLNVSFNKREKFIAGYPYDQPQTIPYDEFRPYPFIKFTFSPSPRNRLHFSYEFFDCIKHHFGANSYSTESIPWDSAQPTHLFNFQWTRFFSKDFYGELKIGYVYYRPRVLAKNELPLYVDLATGRMSGGAGNSQRYNIWRFQSNIIGTYFLDDWAGTHEFRSGAELQFASDAEDVTYFRDPRNQMTAIYTYFGVPMFGIHPFELHPKQEMANIFLFAQDSWNPTKRLALNFGLRFGYQKPRIPVQNEDEGPMTIAGITFNRSVKEPITPFVHTTLAPRLGFVFDLSGNGKTLLKASISRYYLANSDVHFFAVNPNSYTHYLQALDPEGYPIPDAYLSTWVPARTKVGYKDNSLKPPRTDEVTVGLERELWGDFSIGARMIRKWDRNLYGLADASQLDLNKLLGENKFVWTNWEQVYFVDPYDGQRKYFWNQKELLLGELYMVNPPSAKRDFKSFELIFNKRYSVGWSLMASYVWQSVRGLIGTGFYDATYWWAPGGLFSNPNFHVNAQGRLPLERRHQFKLQGMFEGPYGIMVSGFFRYVSGMTYTRTVGSTDLGIVLAQGDAVIYAEERGSRELPALVILDLRLEKSFKMKAFTLGLFVDGFNIFNENKATSVVTTSSSPAQKFEEMLTIQDPRLLRLGARIEF